MMPTNEERRIVAARLRDINPDECINCVSYCDALEDAAGCYIDQRWLGIELCDRLADLIEPEPERTCKNLSTRKDGFGCSVCECEVVGCMVDDFGSWDNPLLFCRCPNCGAKVVENLWNKR